MLEVAYNCHKGPWTLCYKDSSLELTPTKSYQHRERYTSAKPRENYITRVLNVAVSYILDISFMFNVCARVGLVFHRFITRVLKYF